MAFPSRIREIRAEGRAVRARLGVDNHFAVEQCFSPIKPKRFAGPAPPLRPVQQGCSRMKWILTVTAVGSAAALAVTLSAAAEQASSIPPNPQIDVAYTPPTDANLGPIYDRLRKRNVL